MAEQVYENPQLATCLFEALSEMVEGGALDANLADAVRNQVRRACRPPPVLQVRGGETVPG